MKKLILKQETFKDFLLFQRSKDPLKDLDAVSEDVREIISKVKLKGEEALIQYTKKFDNLNLLNINELIFNKDDMQHAYAQLDKKKKESLSYLKERIKRFHESIPLGYSPSQIEEAQNQILSRILQTKIVQKEIDKKLSKEFTD